MEVISGAFEFLSGKVLSIPSGQVILFVLLTGLCVISGKLKLGLLVTYGFVFYWGFLFYGDYFVDVLGNQIWGLLLYTVFGLGVLFLAALAFFAKRRR